MITKSTIDQVYETARVEEVIGDFVSLKKAGSNFKGLSPFSQERSPSFMVSPRDKSLKTRKKTVKKQDVELILPY